MIRSILFIFIYLLIYGCYGHKHQNHIDPVTTMPSRSSVTVDTLDDNIGRHLSCFIDTSLIKKFLETTDIRKNDFQQYNDDEHIHDTIEARLQAKHHLRQSLHQHSDDDDDEYEDDQDCKRSFFWFRIGTIKKNNNCIFLKISIS